MSEWVDLLVFKTWWSYAEEANTWYAFCYRTFNLVEAVFWILFAGLVLRRYRAQRNSTLELWYSFTFFTFGLTDFCEAQALTSWLIWIKLANLVALLKLRAVVIRQFYPQSELY